MRSLGRLLIQATAIAHAVDDQFRDATKLIPNRKIGGFEVVLQGLQLLIHGMAPNVPGIVNLSE
jgi:hypothetical protein